MSSVKVPTNSMTAERTVVRLLSDIVKVLDRHQAVLRVMLDLTVTDNQKYHQKISFSDLQFGDTLVPVFDYVRNCRVFVVFLNDNGKHITCVVKQCYFHIKHIEKSKDFLIPHVRETLVHVLIIDKVEL